MWRPFDPSTMPKTGQVLVTDGDATEGDTYGDMDLICLPVTSEGRTLSQITGNYSGPGTWKWWMPAPPKHFIQQYGPQHLEGPGVDAWRARRDQS